MTTNAKPAEILAELALTVKDMFWKWRRAVWRRSMFEDSQWTIFSKFLLEIHAFCDCSYCQQARGRQRCFEFWMPKDRSSNSWVVLWVPFRGENYYLRWTLGRFGGPIAVRRMMSELHARNR